MWGLSDEEIMKADWAGLDPLAHDRLYVKLTLRHVYEEGGKPCPHQSYPRHEVKRRECPQCWEELKQEAGL